MVRRSFTNLLIIGFSFALITCAQPLDENPFPEVIDHIDTTAIEPIDTTAIEPGDTVEINLPSIDDTSSISLVTWNLKQFPLRGNETLGLVELIMDSLNADFYCLQEIMERQNLRNIVDSLPQYSVILSSETSWMHLAIVYKQDTFLPVFTDNLFADDDYNFAGRPPLLVSFLHEQDGEEQVLNIIDLHMKCCESEPSDVVRRHNASRMLHEYLQTSRANGDSNYVVLGDWNDDIFDPDESGLYSFEAFLNDRDNYKFVTSALAANHSTSTASYPSWNSFLDNILISRSLFDEYDGSRVATLRLDLVVEDYSSVISDHRPVLWSFEPN